MDLRRDGNPDDPERDIALTAELLAAVAARRSPPTLRVFRPGPTVAFGRLDSLRDGFEGAREAARKHGFAAVVRHAGGHAVAYDHESVVVELVRSEDRLYAAIERRFEQLSALIADSLGELGVGLDLGELPDEYCAGRFSLHLPAGPKVAGVAQRVIRGASLTTAVIVVGSGELLRAVTAEVYSTLGLRLDIRTVGAITERFPRIDPGRVADTVAELGVARS